MRRDGWAVIDMAKPRVPWDKEAAFKDYCEATDDNGQPINLSDLSRRYLPEGQNFNNFKTCVYRYAQNHDWKRLRADVWARDGRTSPPAVIVTDAPDAPESTEVHMSDGITCPKCGASLLTDDAAPARNAQIIRSLGEIIKKELSSVAKHGSTAPQMLNSLTGSMDKMIKMQERQDAALQALNAKHSSLFMTDGEENELLRLLPVIIELIARSSKRTYNKIKKQLDEMMPLPPADEPTVVDIKPVRGADE
jgi:hypothetical protein